MKRILCVLILVSLFCVPVYAASAAVTVDIPERSVLVGDQYYVTVSISGNPGFASLQVELFYNSDVVTCVRVVPGDVVKGMLSDSNPCASAAGQASAILSVAGTGNTVKNGTLVTFVFDKPKAGDPGFRFSLVEMRSGNGTPTACEVIVNNQYGSTAEMPGDDTSGGEPADPPPADDPTDIPPSGGTVPGIPPYIWEDPIVPDVPVLPVEPSVPEEPETPAVPDDPGEKESTLPAAFQDDMMQPVISFADVTGAHWAKAYIDEATARGVISGYPDGTFLPDKEMTRAEFTTLLWNMTERPMASAAVPFSDVREADWYHEAIAWAHINRYVNGMTDTEFQPGGTITREQAMTILYRYAGSPDAPEALSGYADRNDISPYARTAMNWAVARGIITGMDARHLAPQANATRAQLCTMIVRYIHYIQAQIS